MNKTRCVLITGASGFIGSALVDHFSTKGWNVIAAQRSTPLSVSSRVRFAKYDMKESFDPTLLNGVDCIIHAAYIKSDAKNSNAYELNLRSATEILAASRKSEVSKNIFISSMSAQPDAVSVYGKQKFAIEKLFNESKDAIVRPGLVIGNGGLVKNLCRMFRAGRFVPLIGGGEQPLQIIQINELVNSIELIIEKDLKGRLTLAHPEVYSFRTFYKTLGECIGKRPVFFSVPYIFPLMFIRFARLLNLPLGITEDNLRGLQKMRAVDTKPDLKKIGAELSDLKTALSKTKL
ncbi:MAG: NAD-dependent epimerase/dehydratase family protein [Bacteroidota bacterium]|nr:NAD-dependent epimerase/dehydratase family protein [Bacteroidota bacterium]